MNQAHTAGHATRFGAHAGPVVPALVAAIAGAALLGWLLKIPVLTSWLPHGASMKVNGTLTLLALSFAMIAGLAARGRRRVRALSIVVAAIALVIVAATAAEYVRGPLGIDQLFASDHSGGIGVPGRMAPNTLAALALLGAATALLDQRIGAAWLSEWLALGGALIAIVALIGYGFGADTFTGFGNQTRMGLNTAICIVLLAATVVGARREHAVRRAVTGNRRSARFLRLAAAGAVAGPVLIGILALAASRLGAFDMRFALSAITFTSMLLAVGGAAGIARYMERAEREAAGHREADALRMLIEMAADGIVMADTSGLVALISPRMLSMLGYREDEVIGRPAIDLVLPEFRDELSRRMKDRFEGGRATYEMGYRRKDGGTLWGLVTASPRLGADGKVLGAFGLVADVTELRAARDRVAQAELESAQKSRFLGMIGHELRTPLNGILGFAQLFGMSSDPLTERQRRWVDGIGKSGQNLLGIVSQLLDLTGATAGTLHVELASVDAGDAAIRAIDEVRASVEGAHLALTVNLADCLFVEADADRLRQCLVNLLANAVKFTTQGGVTLAGALEGDEVVLAVSDTGIGIAPEDFEGIFSEFHQVDGGIKRRTGGLGLGLPLTRKLMNLMGGDVSVASEKGAGSTFSLRLRAAVAAASPRGITDILTPLTES
jgi:PAS domain S-box-containing protein